MELDSNKEKQRISKQEEHKARGIFRCDFLPKRYLVAILSFIGFLNIYASRASLTVAIVAMVTNKTVTDSHGKIMKEVPAEFSWNTKQQGIVLSSFFYGYIITQIPGGYLASYLGGKNLYGGGILLTAFFTLITPVAARSQFHYLILVRALMGFSEGVLFPCMHAVWSQWAPPLERSTLSTISLSGPLAGTLVGMSWSGIIVDTYGWPTVFYFFGCLTVVWCAFWFWLVTDSPFDHPTITDKELNYIRETLADDNTEKQIMRIPFLDILSSIRVWAIIVAHFTENWGFFTLMTSLPTYFKVILHFNLQEAGLLAALPFLVMLIVVPSGGRLADFLRSSGIMSTTRVRKLFNTLGFFSQGAFIIVVGYSENKYVAVFALLMAVGIGGLAWSGFLVNHLDIAPRYAGFLLGISNCAGSAPGIIAPLVVGFVTTNETKHQWRIVFCISASIYAFGAMFFLVFSAGVKQPWADVNGYDSLSSEDDEDVSVAREGGREDERIMNHPETETK